MTSLLTSYHIQHVCWLYKRVYFIVTCHRQRSTKLSTTYANVWTLAFRPMVVILSILLWTRQSLLIWHNFVKIGDKWIKICNLAQIGKYNRCVKNRLKILNRLWKKWKMSGPRGGGFLDLHCILSMQHVICRVPVSAAISWRSLWNRSITLWSLHTENTRLISRGIIFHVLLHTWSYDTSTSLTYFVHFAAFTLSMTLNLAWRSSKVIDFCTNLKRVLWLPISPQ